ncbi:MAG: YdeI/OmpD-associated family protein [Roseiflexaceae bacterium]|nr:YdeI/OmpD-associated family protein [Roseiflexaceae bacterium]
MAPLEITPILYVADRAEWRQWLAEHHATMQAIWLISYKPDAEKPSVAYLHAVEEALCFGWIDGIAKRMDAERLAQRFTPRRPRSHWTELNKERARRLIAEDRMTDAGRAVLPDLSVEAFSISDDILAALQADPQTWKHFQQFPALYQRIRIGYIEEVRAQPTVFAQRLNHFLRKTQQGTMFGTIA